MLKNRLVTTALCIVLAVLSVAAQEYSGNPIFTNVRTADASPVVGEDGRLYVYTSGDHPKARDYSHFVQNGSNPTKYIVLLVFKRSKICTWFFFSFFT